MYSPLIQSIDVLRLEKRLDADLLYLRDALPEYSTFPFDMEQEPLAESAEVPVNPIKVSLILCYSSSRIYLFVYFFFFTLSLSGFQSNDQGLKKF